MQQREKGSKMDKNAIQALEGRELDAMVAEALGCYDIRRHAPLAVYKAFTS